MRSESRRVHSAARRGFSLVELMIVICILGILMGLVLPVISAIMNRVATGKTNAALSLCRLACERYHQDFHMYPWARPQDVEKHMQASHPDLVEIRTRDVLAELSGRGTRNKAEYYLSGLDGQFVKDLGAGKTLVDAWGREIVFRVDPKTMRATVWSLGRNGREETNDGTSPDPVKLPQIYYLYGDGDAGDDLRKP